MGKLIETTREVEVECMLCGKSLKVNISSLPTNLSSIFKKTQDEYSWKFILKDHKLFLCCSECIEKAYINTELKKNKKKIMIEDAEV